MPASKIKFKTILPRRRQAVPHTFIYPHGTTSSSNVVRRVLLPAQLYNYLYWVALPLVHRPNDKWNIWNLEHTHRAALPQDVRIDRYHMVSISPV
jgi:hypothetical protein